MFGAAISGSQVNFCFLFRRYLESTVCQYTVLHFVYGVKCTHAGSGNNIWYGIFYFLG